MRSLAAICIVLIHITSGQVLGNQYAYFVNQLSRFASPMFLMIAGMILVHIEMNRPSPSLGYFYKRRFSRVLIPYLLWSLIYFLFTSRNYILQFRWADLREMFLNDFPVQLMEGSAFAHLYFILIMVQFYALFPLLYRWLQVHASSFLIVSFVLTAGLNGLVYMHQFRWVTLPSLPVPYVVLFVNWIVYFAIGMAVMKYEKRWQDLVLKRSALVVAFLLWISSLGLLLYDGMLTKTYGISVKPSSLLYALMSFLLVYIVVYMIKLPDKPWKTKASRGMEWFASNSFLVYLLHPLCMSILVRLSMFYGKPQIFYGVKGMTLLFLLTMLMTLVGIFLINLTPFSRMLGGAKKARKKAVTAPSVTRGMNN